MHYERQPNRPMSKCLISNGIVRIIGGKWVWEQQQLDIIECSRYLSCQFLNIIGIGISIVQDIVSELAFIEATILKRTMAYTTTTAM